MNDIVATCFWRRLDVEGHDACRLIRKTDGWRLSGQAVFDHRGQACILAYTVDCDESWRTLTAKVDGSIGFAKLVLEIGKSVGGGWLLNRREQPAAGNHVDLDLGFTPATNLIAIRRLDPQPGVETMAPAAYYLEFTQELGRIEQSYRRTGETTLAYSSPSNGYAAELTVSPVGFVTDYPGLWSGIVAVEGGASRNSPISR